MCAENSMCAKRVCVFHGDNHGDNHGDKSGIFYLNTEYMSHCDS